MSGGWLFPRNGGGSGDRVPGVVAGLLGVAVSVLPTPRAVPGVVCAGHLLRVVCASGSACGGCRFTGRLEDWVRRVGR